MLKSICKSGIIWGRFVYKAPLPKYARALPIGFGYKILKYEQLSSNFALFLSLSCNSRFVLYNVTYVTRSSCLGNWACHWFICFWHQQQIWGLQYLVDCPTPLICISLQFIYQTLVQDPDQWSQLPIIYPCTIAFKIL